MTYRGCLGLVKFLLFLQFPVQLPTWCVLEDEIDSCRVVKIAVHPQNVRVSKLIKSSNKKGPGVCIIDSNLGAYIML